MATTAIAERTNGAVPLKEADPPDQHYLDALKSVLESVYEEQDQQIEDLRRNRDLEDPPQIPEWMNVVDTRVQDPTVRDEIARVVATLTMRFPTCAVTPGEPGSDLGQEYSTELEHFLEELFKVCSYRVAGHGTQEALTDACVGDGGGWVKWVVDWHRWEPVFQKGRDADTDDEEVEDEKKRRGPPLARIALDPATIYPVWEADRLTEVLEVSHRQTYPLLREYDLTIEEDGSFGERLGRPLSEEEAQRYPHELEFCFPGDTLVSSDSEITGGYKRRYAGDLVEIRTARGHQLAGTPNHPVMTDHGWIPLGKLAKGDRVLSRLVGERVLPGHPHVQRADLAIEKVFDLLCVAGASQRRPGTRMDFHGDGQQAEVHIVRANRLLRDRLETRRPEPGLEDLLAVSNRARTRMLLAGQGAALAFCETGFAPADRAVAPVPGFLRFMGEPHPLRLFGGPEGGSSEKERRANLPLGHAVAAGQRGGALPSLVPADQLGQIGGPPGWSGPAAHGPHHDSMPEEDFADGVGPGRVGASERLAADAAEIGLDEIVSVRRYFFDGHVYNLETSQHTYYANGILAHNCEHWTGEWISYWVHSGKGSHLLKQIRHGYGQVPYFFAPGLLHNYMNDRKVGLSVASNKLELTRFRSFLITSMVQYAAMQAAAPYFKKSAVPAEAMDGEDRDPHQIPSFEIPYASVISAGSEDDMTLMEHPGIPEGLPQVLGIITSLQQGVDTPKPGPAVGGDLAGAGFAIQSILAEAKTRHHPFVSSLERCMEQEAYFVLHLIQNVIGETVWVRRSLAPGQVAAPAAQWIGMGPSDLGDAVGIRFTLDPEPATSKIVEARYVIEMIQSGLMSLDEGAAYLGRNPDELREGKAMDRMRNEPWYTKFFDERLLRKLNRADILKEAAISAATSGLLPGQDPMLANMAVQARGGGMLGGAPPPGMGPMPPPDAGMLAASPGGIGAAPVPQASPYGLVGANAGQPMGAVLPTAAIQAGVQSIGI